MSWGVRWLWCHITAGLLVGVDFRWWWTGGTLDWTKSDLPNPVIDAVWSMRNNWGASNRSRYNLDAPKWRHFGGGYSTRTISDIVRDIPELNQAVKDEIMKVKNLGMESNWETLKAWGF